MNITAITIITIISLLMLYFMYDLAVNGKKYEGLGLIKLGKLDKPVKNITNICMPDDDTIILVEYDNETNEQYYKIDIAKAIKQLEPTKVYHY